MCLCLLGSHPTCGDHLGNIGVVLGEALQISVPIQIGSAVTDMRQLGGLGRIEQDNGQCRAHAGEPGPPRSGVEHGEVGGLDPNEGAAPYRRCRLYGGAAGDLTTGVAPHAVGDGDDHRFVGAPRTGGGKHGVFVVVADQPGIGGGGPLEPHRTSMMVPPMRTVSPAVRGVRCAIRSPLTNVPLVEPMSSTQSLPSVLSNLACRSDAKPSSRAKSAVSPLPATRVRRTSIVRPAGASGAMITSAGARGPAVRVASVCGFGAATWARTALATI